MSPLAEQEAVGMASRTICFWAELGQSRPEHTSDSGKPCAGSYGLSMRAVYIDSSNGWSTCVEGYGCHGLFARQKNG